MLWKGQAFWINEWKLLTTSLFEWLAHKRTHSHSLGIFIWNEKNQHVNATKRCWGIISRLFQLKCHIQKQHYNHRKWFEASFNKCECLNKRPMIMFDSHNEGHSMLFSFQWMCREYAALYMNLAYLMRLTFLLLYNSCPSISHFSMTQVDLIKLKHSFLRMSFLPSLFVCFIPTYTLLLSSDIISMQKPHKQT